MSTSCCPPSAVQPAPVDLDDLAGLCKALAHPARLQLLRHLIAHGECYFGNLAEVLPLAPSTISQHVSILKQAGLIEGSSDVQRVCYCVRRERLAQLQGALGAL